MSAFPNSKLDAELVNKAVASLLKYESKKAAGSNGKQALLSGYAKPVLVQVPFLSELSIKSQMLTIVLFSY